MTLVEVLVAMVIFSLGVLGAAGLQLSALRSSQFSANAAVATSLAREYEEFLQMIAYAGRGTGYATGGGSKTSGAVNPTFTVDYGDSAAFIDTASASGTNAAGRCNGTTCTFSDMALSYRQEWADRVRNQLPGGRVVVCPQSTPYDPASGDLVWPTCDKPGGYVVIYMGWASKNDQGETIFGTDRPRMAMNVYGNYFDIRVSF